jgi:hypothetical protein
MMTAVFLFPLPATLPLKKLLLSAGLTLISFHAHAGRYESLRTQTAQGPHMQLVGASFRGGRGNEALVDGVELPDGRILAVGNIGGKEGYGFVAAYSPDLGRIFGTLDLKPGEGTFTSCVGDKTGTFLYLAGVAGKDFRSLQRRARSHNGSGKYFLMALNVTNGTIPWVSALDVKEAPLQTMLDAQGRILITTVRKGESELARVDPLTGKADKTLRMHRSDKGGFFTVDPKNGSLLYGSDRNTHTGREPWRQPYFYKLDPASIGNGKPTYQLRLWEWKPNSQIRGDEKNGAYKLESDSSITDAAYSKTGELFLTAWSDGGNSVLFRQPDDLDGRWPASNLNVTTWGMQGANSLSWILKLDPATYNVLGGTQWVTYIPENAFADKPKGNWPNALSIQRIEVIPGGYPSINGKAWTGLVPTPNAFWLRPENTEGKYAGEFVTVFTPDLNRILFSSYLPGYASSRIIPLSDGLLIVGKTKANDGNKKTMATPPVTDHSAQPKFGGGTYDGHIIRLKLPLPSSETPSTF